MSAQLSVVQPLDSTPPPPSASGDQRALAVAAHLFWLVASLWGPLVAYIVSVQHRQSGHARQHAAAALNYHLTSAVALAIGIAWQTASASASMSLVARGQDWVAVLLGTWSSLFFSELVLFLLFGCHAVASFAFMVCASIAAGRGVPYAYPLSIKLVR